VTDKRNVDLVILAGGKGTRVEGITRDALSKVMLPVNGHPFLAYVIRLYAQKGFRHFVLATGHCAKGIENYFGNGEAYGVEISYSSEKEPLGTGGALRLALSVAQTANVLVVNGDTFFDVDTETFLSQHANSHSVVTLALINQGGSNRFGVVRMNVNNAIQEFLEKSPSFGLVSGGVYAVDRTKLMSIIDTSFRTRPLSLENDVWPYLVSQNAMRGMEFHETFLDMGTPESYAAAAAVLSDYDW
jgi:NDP-sugar pyrophosphorylase family protein